MNMLGKIRRLKLRDGLSISEICRQRWLHLFEHETWVG